ncbi:helix-turn-helix transcriptional regulator [Roseivirga seohaensis]|uniref:helix-turn-helix transcriptional regulator n=1 Tax=Roseivirga seohaensis TaxID=1914963 RepID=UPI003BACE4DF
MNRIDRLTAILVQLQSKKVVTAQEIANRFEISLRTVYRDVRALEDAGVPIGAEAGKGYFIMEGYYLPPVMFTQQEANALVLGAKLIEGQTDVSIKRNFTEAMLKIKSVLKSSEKDEIEKLESQIVVRHLPQVEKEGFPNNFLATIQQALIDKSVLRFRYYSSFSGDFTTRDIEPIGLVFYAGRWHLLAYCRLRQAPRDFRVDRLVKLEKLDETYDTGHQPSFSQFLEEIAFSTDLQEVVINIEKTVARYISEQKYSQGFVSEEVGETHIKMKFLTPSLNYTSRWVLTLGDAVEIISPAKLTAMVKERIEELRKCYSV